MRIETFAVGAAIILGSAWAGTLPASAEVRLDTVNTIACAHEGGVCRMPYPTNVYFGVPGKTNGRPFPQGGTIPCNIQSFGDPAPGQAKSCWYAPRITDGGNRYRDDDRPRRGDDRDVYRDRREDRDRYDARPRRDEYRDDDRPRRSYDEEPVRRYRRDPDDE